MISFNLLFTEGSPPRIPKKLIRSYPAIAISPRIRSGWPHIKNTRILATDIFRAQVKGSTYATLLEDFRGMGVKINKEAFEQAYGFTIEWLNYLYNAKKGSKTSL